MDIYDIVEQIVELSNNSRGKFSGNIVDGDLEIHVKGYYHESSRSGEGKIEKLEVIKGELSEEQIDEIKEEFENQVNWS